MRTGRSLRTTSPLWLGRNPFGAGGPHEHGALVRDEGLEVQRPIRPAVELRLVQVPKNVGTEKRERGAAGIRDRSFNGTGPRSCGAYDAIVGLASDACWAAA